MSLLLNASENQKCKAATACLAGNDELFEFLKPKAATLQNCNHSIDKLSDEGFHKSFKTIKKCEYFNLTTNQTLTICTNFWQNYFFLLISSVSQKHELNVNHLLTPLFLTTLLFTLTL